MRQGWRCPARWDDADFRVTCLSNYNQRFNEDWAFLESSCLLHCTWLVGNHCAEAFFRSWLFAHRRKYIETWTHVMHFKWEVIWTHGTQPNTFYIGQVGEYLATSFFITILLFFYFSRNDFKNNFTYEQSSLDGKILQSRPRKKGYPNEMRYFSRFGP